MCLIGLRYKTLPGIPFLLLANRDEYFRRKSLVAAPWAENPRIIGGRDRETLGSWMALNQNGRFAAVTNVRTGQRPAPNSRSRGALVKDFVSGTESTLEFAQRLRDECGQFAPFNLLFGQVDDLYCFHSLRQTLTRLTHGTYGLSNGRLDEAWPKVQQLKGALDELKRYPPEQTFFDLLSDDTAPPVTSLPNTGVGTAQERFLAPVFIHGNDYGTRASTVLTINARAEAQLIEQSWHSDRALGRVKLNLRLSMG